MKKDFINWNNKKIKIDDIKKRPFFHEMEIWFCYLGNNIGFEQDGLGKDFLRPVIILRKFNNEIFWGIPLTKSDKQNIKNSVEKYYYSFSFISGITSVAILSQIRLIDARRLGRYIGTISKGNFIELKKKLKVLLP